MNFLIETYRRRIYKAALLRHQRKTGSNCLVIKLNKGGINTVELTEILLDGLLRKFERLAISEYGSVEAVKAIRGIYSNAVDVNGSGEFLTDSGKELIDELISELVEFVKKQKPVNAEAGNDSQPNNALSGRAGSRPCFECGSACAAWLQRPHRSLHRKRPGEM